MLTNYETSEMSMSNSLEGKVAFSHQKLRQVLILYAQGYKGKTLIVSSCLLVDKIDLKDILSLTQNISLLFTRCDSHVVDQPVTYGLQLATLAQSRQAATFSSLNP